MNPRHAIFTLILVSTLLVTTRSLTNPCDEISCDPGERCYVTWSNSTGQCFPDCSFSCNGGTCNVDVCECPEGQGGNFCEYPSCYSDFCFLENTLSCTGTDECVCAPTYALPTCELYLYSDINVLYEYLVHFWHGEVEDPSSEWCDSFITSLDEDNNVLITCDENGRITTLSFVGGSYMFPDTFGVMTFLTDLIFTSSHLSFVGRNMKHLPYGIKYVELSDVHTPLHDTEDFLGDWGLAAISLENFIYTGDRLASDGYSQSTMTLEFVQQFVNLKSLYMTNAGITGTIPGDIFNIPTVDEVLLVGSEITYVAPLVGERRDTPLTSASLAMNSVNMDLSDFFERLPTGGTTGLYLMQNQFTGPIEIPESFAEFEYFMVTNNMLSGTIPPNFMMDGAVMILLDPEHNSYECPITDYSSWADDTDYSSSFATACSACLVDGCQNGGYCTPRGALYQCECEDGWYGPKCAFETSEQAEVFYLWPSDFLNNQSLCQQSINECNDDFQLTKLRVSDLAEKDISFLSNLTYLVTDSVGATLTKYFPETLETLKTVSFTSIITGASGYDTTPLSLPNLKTLHVTSSSGSLENLNVDLFPVLEEFVYHHGSQTPTSLARSFLNHPTLKTLRIGRAEFTSFPNVALTGNEVLEAIDFTNSSLSADLFLGFSDFCAMMPTLESLRDLIIPGFIPSNRPGMFTGGMCGHILPSVNLDLRYCSIGGTIPSFLEILGLETLLLMGNNIEYPITDYSTWANTTDYSQFNDLTSSQCGDVECDPPNACTLASVCEPLSDVCFPPCLNGGTVIGTNPFFSCSCAEGFYGPVCGFTSQTYEDFYWWAMYEGRIYVNATTDPCEINGCDSGKFTSLNIASAYGHLFTKDDFDTTGITDVVVSSSNIWNAEDFMVQEFPSLENLIWNTNFINDTTFPLNASLSALGNASFQYTQYLTSSTFYHPLRGQVATLILSCDMMKTLSYVSVLRAPFSVEDCSEAAGVQVLNRIALSNVQTNVTTDRLMASLMSPISEFAMNPALTGTFDFSKVTYDLTVTKGSGLAGPGGAITNATFDLEDGNTYTKVQLTGLSPLCPVTDYSAFATTNNYNSYSLANQDSQCTFCRALEGECDEGYYCNNTIPACVQNLGFCDFPQCVNGGTCLDDSCVCQGAYTGTYCEIGPDCGCLNGGTCLDNGTCVCSIFYSGPECATPVINPCECENGGTCLENGTCVCTAIYTGDKCQTPLNPCECENGGTCLLNGTCVCPFNYTGDKCQTYSPNPCGCEHNGTCLENGTCVCPEGYTGDKCQTIYNPCHCQNGGTCLLNGTCVCTPIYSGNKCQTPLNPCDCENGGTCLLNGSCVCPPGYIGSKCQTHYNPCNCENGGVCLQNGTCDCPPNYIGEKCEIHVAPCECENGGTCTVNGICICPEGYTGTRCQQSTNLSDGAVAGVVAGVAVGVTVIIIALINVFSAAAHATVPTTSQYFKMR